MTFPEWVEVLVAVPQGWSELVAAELGQAPCTSVAFGAPSLGTDPAPPGHEYLRTFLSADDDGPAARRELQERVTRLATTTQAEELAGLELRYRRLPPEDYANSWKKTWKPFRLGRVAVVPPGWNGTTKPGDVRLWLEPGGAFGTGRHPTTRACLRTTQERVAPGTSVLDAGCGSGILSAAAALLGAGRVLAFDIDANSVRYAQALLDENDIRTGVELRTGGFEVLTAADGSFDLVLANIYSDIIRQHAGDLRDRIAPGGSFAFSGCPAHHAAPTEAAVRATGLTIEEVRQRGRWVTFIGRR